MEATMDGQEGIRKVRLLLSCLPADAVKSLLQRLPALKSGAIRPAPDLPDSASSSERTEVIREFLDQSSPRRPVYRIDPPQGQVPPFHFLEKLEPADVLRMIADELPQTIAVVLAQLPAKSAVECLMQLSDDRRVEVVRRLGQCECRLLPGLTELVEHLRGRVRDVVSVQGCDRDDRSVLSTLIDAAPDDSTRESLRAAIESCGLSAVAELSR